MASNAAILVVDTANLYYYIGKRFANRKLDYQKLLAKANDFAFVRRAIAYGTTISDEAVNFITCLHKLGYETQYRKPRIYGTGENRVIKRVDWNVGISIDVVRHVTAHRLDTVIVGSTSIELVPLFLWIRENGLRSLVIGAGIPREVRDASDAQLDVSEDLLEDRMNGAG